MRKLYWTCTPHPGNSRVTLYAEENYRTFLDYISYSLDFFLDDKEEDELKEGVSLVIKREMLDEEDIWEG